MIASFLFTCVALANVVTWTLNRSLLEERLPSNVSIEELIETLASENIKIRFDEPDNLLWKGSSVTISLSSAPITPYHLWIAINGKETLDACTKEELAELYAAIWKARTALKELTGAGSFMIFTTEEMRSGKGSNAAGVEILVSGFDGHNRVLDAVEKNAINDYLLYNVGSSHAISYPPEMLASLRERLHTVEPFVPQEEPLSRWTQMFDHHRQALHQNLQTIHDGLKEIGALVTGEMPPLIEDESLHEILINLDTCAFCNPKVIQKQLICDWKEVYLLLGHKPTSPYGNFLIIPKRHQCTWDLTEAEAIASFEVIVALKKLLLETLGEKSWICYIQDGLAMGQTVPHTHIHLYIPPTPLKYALSSVQHLHNQRPILSWEEMRAACEKLQLLLVLPNM